MTYFSSFLRSDLSKNKHFTYMIMSNDLIRCWINEITKYVNPRELVKLVKKTFLFPFFLSYQLGIFTTAPGKKVS